LDLYDSRPKATIRGIYISKDYPRSFSNEIKKITPSRCNVRGLYWPIISVIFLIAIIT